MARKTIKRSASAARHAQVQARDLLLAGIGAVSLGRKQVVPAYANGFEGVAELRSRAQGAVQGAAHAINGKVLALRKQAKAQAAPMQTNVLALATEAKAQAQAQARLAPVLASLGVKRRPAKRSAARKKSAAARSRKAA